MYFIGVGAKSDLIEIATGFSGGSYGRTVKVGFENV